MMFTIESFGTDELKSLTVARDGPCISIYVPTRESGRETQKSPIHLKNLLRDVEHELQSRGMERGEIASLLEPAEAMVSDPYIWQHQSQGLAVFLGKDLFRLFGLPFAVSARGLVGDEFDVTPLLPMLSNDGRFYILALSENAVRLFAASRYGCEPQQVSGMPSSMAETVPDGRPEKQQQRHGGANGSPTYFGSGATGGSKVHKADLKRLFERVNAALTPFLRRHPAPLVLAGVEYLLPIYRSANTCATLLEGEVHGNKDNATPDELREAAWEVAAPHFAGAQVEAMQRFHDLLGSGCASAEVREIETAAGAGRISTLFVALSNRSMPVANRAAISTIVKGGDVFALPPGSMPVNQPLAAIFRF